MDPQNRFINELVRIITGALRLDIDKVRNYTIFLADKLEASGDSPSAVRLRKILEENDHQLHPTRTAFQKVVPVDPESRFPLVERIDVKPDRDVPLILSQEQWDTVNEFVSVSKSLSEFEAEDMAASSPSLMIYGPPGTGKNRVARYVAQELGLELYISRLDGLISSFLGSTAKNIRALFDFASKNPCVLFLDEFDAIAKLRGDSQELGELKRVVNSFIQNLDILGPHSIIIAATNHRELLDSAIWRRFSYRLSLTYPAAELRKQMWPAFISPFSFHSREIDLLVDLSEGFSGSDIREVGRRLRRRQIANKSVPRLSDAFQILRNIGTGEGEDRRTLSKIDHSEPQTVASSLRRRNPKLYSHATIADLFGVSKATAHRWTVKNAAEDRA